MSIGFGSTDGVGSTDAMDLNDQTNAATETWSFWLDWNGFTLGNRIFDMSGGDHQLLFASSSAMRLNRQYASARSQWQATPPSTGQFVHMLWTVDHTDPTTDPVLYYDGSSQTFTQNETGSGSLVSISNDYFFGNRDLQDRDVNGKLCAFARWNRELSAAEIAALANGLNPRVLSSGQIWCFELMNGTAQLVGSSPTVTGTAVDSSNPVIYLPMPPLHTTGDSGPIASRLNGALVA